MRDDDFWPEIYVVQGRPDAKSVNVMPIARDSLSTFPPEWDGTMVATYKLVKVQTFRVKKTLEDK